MFCRFSGVCMKDFSNRQTEAHSLEIPMEIEYNIHTEYKHIALREHWILQEVWVWS